MGCKFFHGLRNPENASRPSKLKVAGSIPAGVAKPMKSNNFLSFVQYCAESGEGCCSTVGSGELELRQDGLFGPINLRRPRAAQGGSIGRFSSREVALCHCDVADLAFDRNQVALPFGVAVVGACEAPLNGAG
jgi:hypothetical protein